MLLAFVSAALTSGCAGVLPKQSVIGAQENRAADDRQAVADYDRQRDQAQYAAAKSRLTQGDEAGCRTVLEQLLFRNPAHREALLLFAELCLAQEQPQAAIERIRMLAAKDPRDARSLHTLAMLLDAADRPAEALHYYERAAAIDPGSELFEVSYHAAIVSAKNRPK